MLAAIAAAAPGADARTLAHQPEFTTLAVPVADPAVLLNLDRPEQYSRWVAEIANSAPAPSSPPGPLR